jgi:hypothetical protein
MANSWLKHLFLYLPELNSIHALINLTRVEWLGTENDNTVPESILGYRTLLESMYTCTIFLSYSNLLLPTHYRCRWLLLYMITFNNTHTQIGTTPLDEVSASLGDLYLITHNTHKTTSFSQPDSNPQSQQVSGQHFRPIVFRDRPYTVLNLKYYF